MNSRKNMGIRLSATLSMFLLVTSITIFESNCVGINEPEDEIDIGIELILINNELTFTMGYSWECKPWNCGYNFEKPAHTVKLSPYYIGKYEITNAEYLKFVESVGYSDSKYWSTEGWKAIHGDNPDSTIWTRPREWGDCDPPWLYSGVSSHTKSPVVGISWYECEAYCNWLCRITGETYRLPTEAEWERAARGPDPGNRYPWGNEWNRHKCNHLAFRPDEELSLRPVGSYEEGKSSDGCYDMAGNAYEYCFDYKITPARDDDYYSECMAQGVVEDPQGPPVGVVRSIRGMTDLLYLWGDIELDSEIRCSFRWSSRPNRRPALPTGFRVVNVIK